jgi:hypothetical protein
VFEVFISKFDEKGREDAIVLVEDDGSINGSECFRHAQNIGFPVCRFSTVFLEKLWKITDFP